MCFLCSDILAFNYARAFNSDISSWDTSAVTLMYKMFKVAEKFNVDISKWQTGAVTNMQESKNAGSSYIQYID